MKDVPDDNGAGDQPESATQRTLRIAGYCALGALLLGGVLFALGVTTRLAELGMILVAAFAALGLLAILVVAARRAYASGASAGSAIGKGFVAACAGLRELLCGMP